MKKILLPFLTVVFLFLSACNKEDDNDNNNTPITYNVSGFGASTGNLTGNPLVLPSGIIINGQILSQFIPCNSNSIFDVNGGDYVKLMVPVKNTSPNTINVTFPAGLVCQSYDTTIQNGILVQQVSVSFPPGFNDCVNFNMYCINANRNGSGDSEIFGNPIVSNNQKIQELLQLLSNKKSNWGQDPNAMNYSSIIQSAVWNVSDYDGLTDTDRSAIATLPNK